VASEARSEQTDDSRAASFRDVFRLAEFRFLWLAHAQSVAGDQLARVALSVLVFNRTGSAGWTALTYAMTILPDLFGGALLAGLADRYSRRGVLVVADLVRAALVALMVLPGQPIAAMVALVFLVQLLFSPWSAARNAILPTVLDGDRFVVGVAVFRTTSQLGMVVGFGAGAALVAVLGTNTTLLIDSGTFLASALLILFGVRAHRPPGASGGRTPGAWLVSIRAGFRLVSSDRRLRTLVALACVSGFYVIPEGLAVPYAAQIHGGTAAVGWLLAANPVGAVLGMLTLRALRPDRRVRMMGPLSVVCCVVLVPTGWAPGLPVAFALWALSGFCSAYDMIANATFVQLVPDHSRGQALGLAGSAMQGCQGVAVIAAGLLAQVRTPATVVALSAGVGVLAALAAAVGWARAASPALRAESGEATAV
jgi:MFS family permease